AGAAPRPTPEFAPGAAATRSSAEAPGPLCEGATQRGPIGYGRLQCHAIDACLHQLTTALLLHALGSNADARAGGGVTRVHQDPLSRFYVLELDPSRIGQIVLSRIADGDRDDFIPRRELSQRLLPCLGTKVGEHHDDGAMTQQLG